MSEIFTGPNKVLLVLGRRTSAHREHCKRENFNYKYHHVHNCMVVGCTSKSEQKNHLLPFTNMPWHASMINKCLAPYHICVNV